ncbi:MAG: hypothetical protein PF590_01195, partial [Candidatus Delongbacteria bacterium]|nr:hypothetical protein [Candidatus Delongbacteria bacterium]
TDVDYKNVETGEVNEFDVNSIPDGDPWEWQETKNELVKEGYEPPIHDFRITTMPLSIENEVKQGFVAPEDLFNATYFYELDGHVEEFPVNELPLSEWTFVSIDSEKEIQPQNVGLIYEKNGESKEFTLFDLPLTSEWRFVDAVYYNPETAVTPDNKTPEDITDLVLKDDRYTFFIISWDILKVKNKNIENLIKLYNYCDVNNMGCLFMTSSTEEDVKTFVKEKDAPFEFYSTDPITLKTMARSNPSILLVKKATILNKWPHKDFPGVDKLSDLLVAQSMEKQVVKSEKFLVWMIGFGIFLLYALIHIFINYLRRKNILNEKRSWE